MGYLDDNSSSGGYYVFSANYPNKVFKFDASTFYNWEQDNLPITDLENRTDWLYNKMGMPGSSMPDATFVLSSTADNTYNCFDDIKDITDRLPKRITSKILIELCSYGDLGRLKLQDISVEDGGALEIISRNSLNNDDVAYDSRFESADVSSISNWPKNKWRLGIGTLENRTLITSVSAVANSAGFDEITGASSVRLQTGCFVSGSTGWNGSHRTFCKSSTGTDGDGIYMSFAHGGGTLGTELTGPLIATDFTDNPNKYGFLVSAYNAVNDATIKSHDASPNKYSNNDFQSNSLTTTYANSEQAELAVNFKTYGNYFSAVDISNCKGPITLTNICVDSASGSDNLGVQGRTMHRGKAGFSVTNSDGINLQGCAAARNRYYGFMVDNSKVKVSRGIIAYRNYPLYNQTRAASALPSLNANEEFEQNASVICSGVGFYANNSVVLFDTSSDNFNNVEAERPSRLLCDFHSNGTGFYAKNSHILGGVGGNKKITTQGGGNGDWNSTLLRASCNTGAGFLLENSVFKYEGIPWAAGNDTFGMDTKNSIVEFGGVVAEHNGLGGLRFGGSNVKHGLGIDKYYWYLFNNAYYYQRYCQGANRASVCLHENGGPGMIIEKGSTFEPVKVQSMDKVYGYVGGQTSNSWLSLNHLGASGQMGSTNPDGSYHGGMGNVIVRDHSTAELIHYGAVAGATIPDVPTRGGCLSVTNNSRCTLRGTSFANTCMSAKTSLSLDSMSRLERSWHCSNMYAGQNSQIYVMGPTKISGFGIGGLAEDNSIIKFCPHLDEYGNFDFAGYALSGLAGVPSTGENHTKVEIHSTRSCLVANRNSTIEMKHLGGSANVEASSTNLALGSQTADFAANGRLAHYWGTGAGYMQFYPHGFTQEILNTTGGKGSSRNFQSQLNLSQTGYSKQYGSEKSKSLLGRTSNFHGVAYTTSSMSTAFPLGAQEDMSTGGMCVRALGGSNIIADFVNFPMSMCPSSTSGVYYNIAGSGNEHVTAYDGLYGRNGGLGHKEHRYGGSQIFMWNIADNSRLKASNLLVSGVDPSSVGGVVRERTKGSLHIGMGAGLGGAGTGYHGPAGKWGLTGRDLDAAPLDYYGSDGNACYTIAGSDRSYLAPSSTTRAEYLNSGPFRLMLSVPSDLVGAFEFQTSANNQYKKLQQSPGDGDTSNRLEASALGGTPVSQVISQGYTSPGWSMSACPAADSRGWSVIDQMWHSDTSVIANSDQKGWAGEDRGETNPRGYGYMLGKAIPGAHLEDIGRAGTALAHAMGYGRRFGDVGLEDYSQMYASTEDGLVQPAQGNVLFARPYMDWGGMFRNYLDESAADVFANSKHLANSQNIRGCTIYRSSYNPHEGGEGRDAANSSNQALTFGVGCRSLNIFDLEELV